MNSKKVIDTDAKRLKFIELEAVNVEKPEGDMFALLMTLTLKSDSNEPNTPPPTFQVVFDPADWAIHLRYLMQRSSEISASQTPSSSNRH